MRVAILGAGSIGCFIGACWKAAGIDVRLVGRSAIRDEVARHRLTASDRDGWSASSAIAVETDAKALAGAQVIALTVKRMASETAAGDIARHADKGATIVTLQNGVGAAEQLAPLLPDQTVVQGMVPYNVAHAGPGHWRRTTWGDLTVARSPATEALARAIGDRPGRLVLSDDMPSVCWGKLLLNLNNAINALSDLRLLDQLRQRDFRRVLAAAMLETLALLDTAGIEPAKIGQIPPRLLPHAIAAPDCIFNNLFLAIQKIDPQARSSMADDLAAGRATEIAWLNGEVVRQALALGRTAPVNAAIVDLVNEAEAGVERVWDAASLRKRVLSRHKDVAIFGY